MAESTSTTCRRSWGMSMSLYRQMMRAAFAALGFSAFLALPAPVLAQEDDPPEEGRFRTADGLRLYYQWFAGGKGQKSDTVLLVPNYGSDISKGPWTPLARALQKQGYSVLMFDFRGHGKSADFKVMDKPEI